MFLAAALLNALSQFLVVPEWMETRHFEACQAAKLFDETPDAFVGSTTELSALMTLPGLHHAFEIIGESDLQAAGHERETMAAQWASPGALEEMHLLRNDRLFALHIPRGGRRGICGRPMQ